MFNLKDNNIFVKGFAQKEKYDVLMQPSECKGEFVAIITDLVTSDFIKVTSAIPKDGKWVLKCADGVIRTFEQEPATSREMLHGKLVKNYESNFLCDHYDVVFPDEYSKARRDIDDGDRSYRLVGYVNKQQVASSSLIKFWTDSSGKKHGMTKSGSHYIFY